MNPVYAPSALLLDLTEGKRPTLSQFNQMTDREQRLCLCKYESFNTSLYNQSIVLFFHFLT